MLLAGLGWRQIPAWDALTLTSGPYLYAEVYKDLSARKGIGLEAAMREGRELLFFKEGLQAAVAVDKRADGDLALEINGKTDATAKGDAPTQLMLGHLPLLLHGQTERVLVIGLGSGMTVGAVTLYPVKAVDVVEVEPAVVEASEYFRAFTGDALRDPRVSLVIADGRHHLAMTDRRYDVIVSEPSNLWISGIANLFSREFFDLARGRLRPGGVMVQWVHAYSMSSGDFKTVVRTFQAAFPHTTLWEVTLGGDYLLVGSAEKWRVDYGGLSSRLRAEGLRADLRRMSVLDVGSLLGRLLMEEEAIGRYTRGAPLHTDDNALLEYSTPRALGGDRASRLVEEAYRERSDPGRILKALGWAGMGTGLEGGLGKMFEARREVLAGYLSLVGGAEREAVERLGRARALNPTDYDGAYLLAKVYFAMGERAEGAGQSAEARAAYTRSIGVIVDFLGSGRGVLSDLFELAVVYARAHLQLGVMALKANVLEEAAEAFRKSMAGGVELPEAHNNLGAVYERRGRYAEAMAEYERALAINPKHAGAHVNVGNVRLKQGRYEEAVESYRRAQKLRPDFATVYYNLGVAYSSQGQWEKASREWSRALELRPDFPEAQRSLEDARKKLRPG